MARKGVGGKNKPKDVDGRLRGDRAKSERINAAENENEKSDRGRGHSVGTRENVAKGVGKVDEKAKGDTSMAKKSGSMVRRGENAGKRKIVPDDQNAEKAITPAKRRRNADMEIAEAFVSSTEKGSYDLRARRGVPSFRKVDLSESCFGRVVGKRVKVFWFNLQKWFTGRIESYDDKKKKHKVLYDDGDKGELDLKRNRFELEVMPGEAFTLSSKYKLNARKKEMDLDGGSVSAESVKEASLKMDVEQVKKYSKPKREVVTKDAKNGGSKLQERMTRSQKGKDIMGEMKDVKEASPKPGDVEPLEKNSNLGKKMATKVAKGRGTKSHNRENTEGEKTEGMASQKTASDGVSDARTKVLPKNKKGEHQVNVESRENSVRKGRTNVKIKK